MSQAWGPAFDPYHPHSKGSKPHAHNLDREFGEYQESGILSRILWDKRGSDLTLHPRQSRVQPGALNRPDLGKCEAIYPPLTSSRVFFIESSVLFRYLGKIIKFWRVTTPGIRQAT